MSNEILDTHNETIAMKQTFLSNAIADISTYIQLADTMENHPNWFDASYISWLSYDSLNIELPDGHLFFAPIINWGRYREENRRFMMPLTVRLNHAIADGYLVAKVFKLLEEEISNFTANKTNKQKEV